MVARVERQLGIAVDEEALPIRILLFINSTVLTRRQRPGWLTFQVISAITTSPNLPESRYSLARMYFAVERRCVPT